MNIKQDEVNTKPHQNNSSFSSISQVLVPTCRTNYIPLLLQTSWGLMRKSLVSVFSFPLSSMKPPSLASNSFFLFHVKHNPTLIEFTVVTKYDFLR